jgi:hypothetical protein
MTDEWPQTLMRGAFLFFQKNEEKAPPQYKTANRLENRRFQGGWPFYTEGV